MGLGVNKPSNDFLRSSRAVCRLFDVQRDEKTEGGWFWSRLVPRNCQVHYHNFRLRSVMQVVCCGHLPSYFTLCKRISHDFIRAHRSGGNNFAPFVTCVEHVTNVSVFYSASSLNCTSVHALALRWLMTRTLLSSVSHTCCAVSFLMITYRLSAGWLCIL